MTQSLLGHDNSKDVTESSSDENTLVTPLSIIKFYATYQAYLCQK